MADIKLNNTAGMLGGPASTNAGYSNLVDQFGNQIARRRSDVAAETDSFQIVGGMADNIYHPLRVDSFGSVATKQFVPQISENFVGTTISTSRLSVSSTTFTSVQTAAGGLSLNSSNSTAASGVTLIKTLRHVPTYSNAPKLYRTRLRVATVANSIAEWGLGDPTGTTQVPVGIYYQKTAAGVFQGVVTFNGTEVSIPLTQLDSNNYYTFDIAQDDNLVEFIVTNTETGTLAASGKYTLAASQTRMLSLTHLPCFARLMNTATLPASAPLMIVSSIDLGQLDQLQNKPWSHVQTLNGLGGHTNPVTFAQFTQMANSAEPTNAALSNTTASYTTLGGKFQFAAVAGAATDYCLFGPQIPLPYSYVLTGIRIDTWNTVIASATTPTLLHWAVGVNQVASSLATAGIVRQTVGAQSIPVGSAPGFVTAQVERDFQSAPLVTHGNRFLTVILRMPVGTATATQVIAGMVSLVGYFE